MYRKGARSWVKHLDFTFFDLFCAELSLVAAYFWRFYIYGDWEAKREFYTSLALILVLVDIVVVFFSEPYSGILSRNKYQEFRATVTHCIVVFAGVLIYLYATQQSGVSSRSLLAVFGILMVFSCYFMRVTWKRLIRYRKLADKNKSEMLVVAETYNVEGCLKEIARDKYSDYRVMGVVIVDEDMTGKTIGKIPVVASADTFMEYVRTTVIDEVFIDGNTRSSSEALAAELVELGITVHIGLFHSDTP
ncbi:MAG: sugar transferase, partial [Lachnospiraceae bacterium]|nr:sugar transferase [Lachnospiraceae bacterium]